jgi:hypothetical protein
MQIYLLPTCPIAMKLQAQQHVGAGAHVSDQVSMAKAWQEPCGAGAWQSLLSSCSLAQLLLACSAQLSMAELARLLSSAWQSLLSSAWQSMAGALT